MAEASQNAGRADQSVQEMNALKADIVAKIAKHENAIILSGQAAEGAHARLTAVHVELDAYAGRSEATFQEIKTAGDLTRAQTMEAFQK